MSEKSPGSYGEGDTPTTTSSASATTSVSGEESVRQGGENPSKGGKGKENPLRFGAEFGPTSVSGTTQGVSLGTFKQLVWISNLGGLILFVIGLELLLVQGMPVWGIVLLLAGTIIALFPSNFEIVGMSSPEMMPEESKGE